MISPQFKTTFGSLESEVKTMSPEASWTFEAVQSLVALAREGVPVSIISLKLKRSSTDVRAKLSDLGITPSSDA
jgi:hypothetical protein